MRSVVLVGLAAAASCGGNDDCCAIDAAPPPMRVDVVTAPVTVNRDVDILFVMDDTTLELQTATRAGLGGFLNELSSLIGGLPNLHIGVVSTDLGTKGALDAQAGPPIGSGAGSCSGNGKSGNLLATTATITGVFISDIKNPDGTRTTNYSGTLDSALGSLLSLGGSGCGFEQPLEAAKRALNNNPANAGFLRPNANLAIVFITDEDDCSMSHSTLMGSDTATLGPLSSFRCTRFGVRCAMGGTTTDMMNMAGEKMGCASNEESPYLMPVAPYAQFFAGLKSNPTHMMLAAIAGPRAPVTVELRTPPGGGVAVPAIAHSCRDNSALVQIGDPGVRIAHLLDLAPRSHNAEVCSSDYTPALVDIARQIRSLVGDACISRAITTPDDCQVFDVRGATETQLPACSATVTVNCYRFVSDASCTAGPHLRVVIERNEAPPPDTVTTVRCFPA